VIFERRFSDLIDRQLDLFASDNADLIARCDAAERAYDDAPREDAEERYSEYLDLVESGSELLVEIRDAYAETLDQLTAAEYESAFNHSVVRRFPRFALELE
jgi:hypothetical protein